MLLNRGDGTFLPPTTLSAPGNFSVGLAAADIDNDGSAEILIDCEGFEWVTGWVLGLGRHAWIVGPDDARAAMRERIARVRAALPM